MEMSPTSALRFFQSTSKKFFTDLSRDHRVFAASILNWCDSVPDKALGMSIHRFAPPHRVEPGLRIILKLKKNSCSWLSEACHVGSEIKALFGEHWACPNAVIIFKLVLYARMLSVID